MRRLCLVVFIFLCATSARASLTNVYIAQTAAGGDTGADCNNAHGVMFFNTAGNWGAGAAQIGAGTTVHLCGTFTGAANTIMLTIRGNGASGAGNSVTILFESGANLTAPYWSSNGAINCSSHNFIIIDGGTNGQIQNTSAGTNLANNNVGTNGIYLTSCNNIEVRKLNIQNIYVHSGLGSDGGSSGGIVCNDHCDQLSIHDNTIAHVHSAIFDGYNTFTSTSIYNNTTNDHVWGIAVLDNGGSNGSGLFIYGNTIGPSFFNWKDTGFSFHYDGIFFTASNPGSSLSNVYCYNNFVHGDMDVAGSGYIFVGAISGTLSNINVFNNVIVHEIGTQHPQSLLDYGSAASGTNVYNNTFVSTGHDPPTSFFYTTGSNNIKYQNNVMSTVYSAYYFWPNNYNPISASDFNVFFNQANIGCNNYGSGPVNCIATLGSWQSSTGFDAHSVAGNPNLDSNYRLQSGSAAIGMGTNLTGVCIGQPNPGLGALCFDKAGVARPSTGAWDAGAYQLSLSGSPAPPTGLKATVH